MDHGQNAMVHIHGILKRSDQVFVKIMHWSTDATQAPAGKLTSLNTKGHPPRRTKRKSCPKQSPSKIRAWLGLRQASLATGSPMPLPPRTCPLKSSHGLKPRPERSVRRLSLHGGRSYEPCPQRAIIRRWYVWKGARVEAGMSWTGHRRRRHL